MSEPSVASEREQGEPGEQPVAATPRAVQIAIDGGAGAGKSTLGERLAQRLGHLYVDSGAFYRALTALALARGVAPTDEAGLVALAQSAPVTIITPTPEDAANDGRQYTVLVTGTDKDTLVDITHELRTVAVERAVSPVARHSAVRQTLIAQMRAMADTRSVVMVGRDIGTVVLPDATLKIYLTASLAARAERRHADLLAAEGPDAPTLDAVRADLEARDAKDAAQMLPAEDAHTIANDQRTVDEVVEQIVALLAGKGVGDGGLARPTHGMEGAGMNALVSTTARTDSTPAAPAGPSGPPSSSVPRSFKAESSLPHDQAEKGNVGAGNAAIGKPGPMLNGTATPWFYALMRLMTLCVAPFVVRLRVEGVENVPKTGPVMLAVNHIAWPDIPFAALHIPRIVHYMAKIENFQIPVLGRAFRMLGAFPVRRGEGDRESLRTAERLLAEGEAFAIFPEGHRTGGHLIKGLPGVALIALRADAPIVPIAISGTEHVFKGLRYGPFAPRVTIRYGKPFSLPQGSGRRSKADLEHGVDEIMLHIARLLPPEYRGIYADAVVGALRDAPEVAGPPAKATPDEATARL
ncbi:MAG: (d)CMP kinase [Ktedonobacterales bacterium]